MEGGGVMMEVKVVSSVLLYRKEVKGLGWGGVLALREIGDLPFLWLGREGRM